MWFAGIICQRVALANHSRQITYKIAIVTSQISWSASNKFWIYYLLSSIRAHVNIGYHYWKPSKSILKIYRVESYDELTKCSRCVENLSHSVRFLLSNFWITKLVILPGKDDDILIGQIWIHLINCNITIFCDDVLW